MIPQRVTVTGEGSSRVIMLDQYVNGQGVAIAVNYIGSASGTSTVEYTLDDIQAPGYDPDSVDANWFVDTGFAPNFENMTGSTSGNYDKTPIALRLRRDPGSIGDVEIQVVQNGQ